MSSSESSNSQLISRPEQLIAALKSKISNVLVEARVSLNVAEVRINRKDILNFFPICKLDVGFNFEMLLSLTAVDYLDRDILPRSEDERFEVVYHLLSVKNNHRLRVKVAVPEQSPEIDSVVNLWPGADFMESEVYDMYGIRFKGHPDLRRILMYDEFVGYPLRKDYPVQGKQPRIEMRAPEVENTARLMLRPDLVRINKPDKKVSTTSAATVTGIREEGSR